MLEPSLDALRVVLVDRPLALPRTRIVNTLRELQDHLGCTLDGGHRVVVLGWPHYTRRLGRLQQAVDEIVRRAVRMSRITAMTLERRLPVWTEHLLRNLPRCVGRVPAWCLDGHLRGRAAVLVSAGPSLDRNVAQLAAVDRDRVAIMAVNTSIGALERAGVRADFVVTLELLDVSPQFEGLRLNRDKIGRASCRERVCHRV